jgi:ribosomal protein S27AE
MTTQTKTFIELSDILSVRVECGKCHSTVTIPIDRKMSFSGMGHCPNCGEAWLQAGPTTKEPEMKACFEMIRATADILKNWQETLTVMQSKGFSLTLEIRADDDHLA